MPRSVILGNTNLNYSWFVLTFNEGLLRNGHEVSKIDYKSTPLKKIKNQLIRLNPKYVFTHLSFHGNINNIDSVLQMYGEVKRETGCMFIHTMNDARKVDRYMSDVTGAIDVAFVGNTDCIEKCSNDWNIPVYFCPYTTLCYNDIADPVSDLMFENPVFCGSPSAHKDRSEFIKKLRRIMDIEIFSTQSKHDLRHRTPELSASASCILGLCTGYDVDRYIDVRPFQYLGTGAFMIIRKFKNMDDIIPDYLYVPFNSYNDPKIVKDLFDEWKYKDTMPMRYEAFEYIQRFHSCKERLKNVIRVLEGKQETTKSLRREYE